MIKKKRLPWRCANEKQAKDKAEIYNSSEWRELRIQKLRDNPLCERCYEQNRYVSAHVVHHIIPIETAHNMADMKWLAFDFSNLQSLCDKCHADIHNEAGYHTREAVRQRSDDRQKRWEEKIMARFAPDYDHDPTD